LIAIGFRSAIGERLGCNAAIGVVGNLLDDIAATVGDRGNTPGVDVAIFRYTALGVGNRRKPWSRSHTRGSFIGVVPYMLLRIRYGGDATAAVVGEGDEASNRIRYFRQETVGVLQRSRIAVGIDFGQESSRGIEIQRSAIRITILSG